MSKFMLAWGVAALFLGLAGIAAAESTTNRSTRSEADKAAAKIETTAAKAGTVIEKSVGAGDKFTQAELDAATPLTAANVSTERLLKAKVDDASGQIIGKVRKINSGKDGEMDSLHVDVGGWLGMGEKVVSFDANDFQYLESRNILIANVSKQEAEAMQAVGATKKAM
jgi:hypothetical protein